MKLKIYRLTLLVYFAFTITAFGQDAKPPKGFDLRYDKFKDTTEVSFWEFGGFAGWFTHQGKTLEKDVDPFLFTFRGSRCSGYCFKNPSLIFIIDGERVNGGTREPFLGDSVTFDISRNLLQRIANAAKVEWQVGEREFYWKEKTLAKFKTLLDLGTVKK